jgi:hypothetical protein
MNTSQLEQKLQEHEIRPDCYSLDGSVINEALILEPSNGNGWRIYYSERGLRSGEKVFFTEEEACVVFLEMLLRDPMVKRRV